MEMTKNLVELDKKHYLHPTTSIKDNFTNGPSVMMARGEGIYLYDTNGKKYLDGLSSLWNVNVGHGRAEIAEVAKQQMETLAYTHSFNHFSHPNVIQLAEKMAELAPGDLNVCQFTSGGSESNDTVFKLVRHYFKLKGEQERFKIIARERAYHGISMGATSATGIPVFRHMGGPLAGGFVHAKAPYCYRCATCTPECHGQCALDSIVTTILQEGPASIAAIIVEPIQGAGGVIVPPAGHLKQIRAICDQYGILMIADEVITGFGRTGTWFGVEHDQVVPDFMTFAKGITSGYIPLGGVIISEKIHREMADLSAESAVLPHGYTYSGHPTACAVALKNIEIIEKEQLVENASQLDSFFREGLETIKNNHAIVGNVTAKGLIGSLEFVEDQATKKAFDPAKKVSAKIFEACFKRGLISRGIAIDNTDIVALCPPLIINQEQLTDALTIMDDAVQEVSKTII